MKRRSSLRRAIVTLVVLTLLTVAGYFAYKYATKPKPQENKFQKMTVSKGEIHLTILSTGTVAPENRLDIKPPVAGRVDKLLVDEGFKVVKGQTLAWMSSAERAALMDAASAKGPEVVKEWEQLFRPTPIVAPIAGTIIKKNVVAGQTFGTGDAVFTMSDHLTVNAQVDETDIGQIRLKQPAAITLDAYRDVQTFGKVTKIAFDATTVNNVTTYVVKILPDNVPTVMRSGMTANVIFDVQTKSDILIVPNGAIKVRESQSYVLLPPKSEELEPSEQPIKTGITDGKFTEILEGLKEGDVILVPEFKLKDQNQNVNPFSPMSRPPPRRVS